MHSFLISSSYRFYRLCSGKDLCRRKARTQYVQHRRQNQIILALNAISPSKQKRNPMQI